MPVKRCSSVIIIIEYYLIYHINASHYYCEFSTYRPQIVTHCSVMLLFSDSDRDNDDAVMYRYA